MRTRQSQLREALEEAVNALREYVREATKTNKEKTMDKAPMDKGKGAKEEGTNESTPTQRSECIFMASFCHKK